LPRFRGGQQPFASSSAKFGFTSKMRWLTCRRFRTSELTQAFDADVIDLAGAGKMPISLATSVRAKIVLSGGHDKAVNVKG